LTTTVVDPAEWAALTTFDFRLYKALVIPEGLCNGDYSAAIANRHVWSPAVTGNVIVVGTSELLALDNISPGDTRPVHELTRKGLRFATSAPGSTGAYISRGCHSGDDVERLLDPFGTFNVTAACGDVVKVVDPAPLPARTREELSGWDCSAQETFEVWGTTFKPLAIALDARGRPYILTRGPIGGPCRGVCFIPPTPGATGKDPSEVFDSNEVVALLICKLERRTCGPTVAAFFTAAGRNRIQVNSADEYYWVRFAAESFDLDPTAVYRVRLLSGGRQILRHDTSLPTTGLIEIRFRVEAGVG
jgi:hypothetical protein